MILLVHMLFGAAVGYQTYALANNIWLASIAALLSHYFLDFFPHIEYLKSTEETAKKLKNGALKNNLGDFLKVIADFCFGLVAVFAFSPERPTIYLFTALAILPDGLTILNEFLSIPILKKHHEFHGQKIHFFKHKKVSLFWRLLSQVVAVVFAVFLLI